MNQENEFLEARRRALEEQFFHGENQRLVEKLRETSKLKESKEALAEESGLTSDVRVHLHLLRRGGKERHVWPCVGKWG